MLLAQIIDLYSFVVLATVIVSWLNLPPHHPIANFLNALTEPVLKPIRQFVPPMGGLDFSALILLFALSFLRRALY